MQEQQVDEEINAFNCLLCLRKAHLPVVTRCAHLYCWRCFHQSTNQTNRCPLCSEPVVREELYPLFIENEHVEEEEAELPERPPPKNLPKIVNADIISSQREQSRNNIAMGQLLAGSLFLPALAVSTWVVVVGYRVRWVMQELTTLQREPSVV